MKSSLSHYSCHLSAPHWANLNSQRSVGTSEAKPRLFIIDRNPVFFFFFLWKECFHKSLDLKKKKAICSKENTRVCHGLDRIRELLSSLCFREKGSGGITVTLAALQALKLLFLIPFYTRSTCIFVNKRSLKLWVQRNRKTFMVNLVGLKDSTCCDSCILLSKTSMGVPDNYKIFSQRKTDQSHRGTRSDGQN